MNDGASSRITDSAPEVDRDLIGKLLSSGFTILGIGFPVMVGALAALRDPGLSSTLGRRPEKASVAAVARSGYLCCPVVALPGNHQRDVQATAPGGTCDVRAGPFVSRFPEGRGGLQPSRSADAYRPRYSAPGQAFRPYQG
jgi:hypothetical protein